MESKTAISSPIPVKKNLSIRGLLQTLFTLKPYQLAFTYSRPSYLSTNILKIEFYTENSLQKPISLCYWGASNLRGRFFFKFVWPSHIGLTLIENIAGI